MALPSGLLLDIPFELFVGCLKSGSVHFETTTFKAYCHEHNGIGCS